MGSLLEVVNNIVSFDSDTIAEQALEGLCSTCESFKTAIIPYVPQLVSLSKTIIKDDTKSINLR